LPIFTNQHGGDAVAKKQILTSEKLKELVDTAFDGLDDMVGLVWIDYMGSHRFIRMAFPGGRSRKLMLRAKLLLLVLESMTMRKFTAVIYTRDMTWEESEEITARIRHIGIAG